MDCGDGAMAFADTRFGNSSASEASCEFNLRELVGELDVFSNRTDTIYCEFWILSIKIIKLH